MSQIVALNLSHHQLWLDVRELDLFELEACIGTPPKKLHPEDEKIQPEIVLVSYLKENWSVARWADAFKELKTQLGLDSEPKRVVMAMITDDSTVVYYLVHNGLVEPRKN